MLKTLKTTVVSLTISTLVLFSSSALAGKFDDVTLRVATWGGLWKGNIEENIVPKFEAEGGKVEFITGSPAANFAKIIAARGEAPFDVVEILAAQVKDYHELDVLHELDLQLIPNTEFLASNRYNESVVGSWETQEVICYHKDKFAEEGIPVPTTYRDLVHPKIAGRLLFPDINSGGGLPGLAGVAFAEGGNETNIKPGLKLVTDMNVLKFWARGGESMAQFESGDIIAAVVHAGWCLRSKTRAGQNVASVHPRINDDLVGVASEGWFGVMKNSKNVEAAQWYINEFISADYQLKMATQTGLVPVNQSVFEEMAKDPVVAEMIVLDPEKVSNQLRIDYSKVIIADWTDQWNRAIAAQ